MRTDSLTHAQALASLRALVRLEGTAKAAATVYGVSPQYLSDVLNGRREISEKLAKALGFERYVAFRLVGR